jgi:hypothetical protein
MRIRPRFAAPCAGALLLAAAADAQVPAPPQGRTAPRQPPTLAGKYCHSNLRVSRPLSAGLRSISSRL